MAVLAVVPLCNGQPPDAASGVGEVPDWRGCLTLRGVGEVSDWRSRLTAGFRAALSLDDAGGPSNRTSWSGWAPVGSAIRRIALPVTVGSLPNATATPVSAPPVSSSVNCSGTLKPFEVSVTIPLLSVTPAAAGFPGAVIVTVAEPDCVVSSTLVAVTVTGLVLGTELGAV
jgi:hypothetical protein